MLFAELGSGTVGTTFIGRQVGHVRGAFKPLVVRLLEPHLSQRPDIVRLFLDEQRAAALLQHPRIAAIQEVGLMPEGAYFMAAEYIHGVPLREVLRAPQAQLSVGQAVHLAMQVCDALHYAHERLDVTGKPLRILHGQLSPDAVIVGFDGNAKVTEFGLLRTRDAATATIPTLLQRRTAFLSPELRAQLPLRAAPSIDRRTDIYSIGALLWEMLTGESLVPSEDGHPPPAPSLVRPVDPQLDAIVMRALARAPGDRFPTALAMRLALTGVATSLSADGSVATALARSLTMAFRERIVAFQEQFDLWRKFEDDVMPDGPSDSGRSQSKSGMGPAVSGQRNMSSGIFTSTSSQSANLSAGRTSAIFSSYSPSSGSSSGSGRSFTPQPNMTPQSGAGSSQKTPVGVLRGRLYSILLTLAILGIVVGGALIVLGGRGPIRGGVLLIDSQPRGAQIRVDGRPAGVTPFRISDLRGEVQVEVYKEGYQPWRRPFTPQPGRTQQVDVELQPEGP